MRLRRATPEDLPALVSLFDGYRQFYQRRSDLPLAEAFLSERLRLGDSAIFVAEGAPGLLGFVQLYPIFSSLSAERAWLLNDLFVAPSARKGGVGRALLECAERFGRETGARWLSLSTQQTNLPAQRLYEALGWVRDQEFFHYELDLS